MEVFQLQVCGLKPQETDLQTTKSLQQACSDVLLTAQPLTRHVQCEQNVGAQEGRGQAGPTITSRTIRWYRNEGLAGCQGTAWHA